MAVHARNRVRQGYRKRHKFMSAPLGWQFAIALTRQAGHIDVAWCAAYNGVLSWSTGSNGVPRAIAVQVQ